MSQAPGSAADASLAGLLAYVRENHLDQLELLDRLKSSYMRTNRDKAIADHLEGCLRILATRPSIGARHEGRGIVLIGETGSGKTHMTKRLLATHPLFPGFGIPGSGCAAISVVVPGSCTLKVLGLHVLRATGYPIEDAREHVVWDKVRNRLRNSGVLLVHLDEVNNLVGTSSRETDRKITNHFKSMLNRPDWPLILVLSGTPACEPILRSDEELARRMDWVHVAPIVTPRDNAKVSSQLHAFCRIAGVNMPEYPDTVLVPKIVHATAGRLGVLMELCVDAVAMAHAERAATLTSEHFASVHARRTGCTADANPFVAALWRGEKEAEAARGGGARATSATQASDEKKEAQR